MRNDKKKKKRGGGGGKRRPEIEIETVGKTIGWNTISKEKKRKDKSRGEKKRKGMREEKERYK